MFILELVFDFFMLFLFWGCSHFSLVSISEYIFICLVHSRSDTWLEVRRKGFLTSLKRGFSCITLLFI